MGICGLSEEEKKAIEYIQQFIGIKKEYEYLPIKVKTLPNTRNAIQVVLNLIQKQESEIDKLNNVIDRMAKDIRQTNKNLVDEGYYVEPFWLDEEGIKEYFMKEDI